MSPLRQRIMDLARRPGGLASNDKIIGKSSKVAAVLLARGELFAARFVGIKPVTYFAVEAERDEFVRQSGLVPSTSVTQAQVVEAFARTCEAVGALAKRKGGVGTSEAAHITGICIKSVNRAIQRLCLSGAIHRGQAGYKRVRYFATAAEALEYGPPRAEIDAPVTVRASSAWRNAPEDRSTARIYIAPKPLDRWNAAATMVPMFSAMRPGEYLTAGQGVAS